MIRAAAHDGIRVVVRVTPKGGHDAIEGFARDANDRPLLKVRLAAAPADGKANAALVSLLAEEFAVAKSAVTILHGVSARVKQVHIRGNARKLAARLKAMGESA